MRSKPVKVKICGITRLKDALVALHAGCDALGFIFYRKSPRYISPARACLISQHLPTDTITIGVFVNARASAIKDIARRCGLRILQFHGDESPAFCRQFKNFKIIKAFRITNRIDMNAVARYDVFAYLFDAFSPSRRGGTGRQFNWELLDCSGKIKKPIFLSGGLNPGNVARAVELVQPAWVDVSSGVESRPGIKDPRTVRRFIAAVKKPRR